MRIALVSQTQSREKKKREHTTNYQFQMYKKNIYNTCFEQKLITIYKYKYKTYEYQSQ